MWLQPVWAYEWKDAPVVPVRSVIKWEGKVSEEETAVESRAPTLDFASDLWPLLGEADTHPPP